MMSMLEQSIRDICAAHNLHAFSVGFLIPNDERGQGWTVDIQRWESDKPICGWNGMGNSIADALADALAKLPPSTELADEPLPIEQAA